MDVAAALCAGFHAAAAQEQDTGSAAELWAAAVRPRGRPLCPSEIPTASLDWHHAHYCILCHLLVCADTASVLCCAVLCCAVLCCLYWLGYTIARAQAELEAAVSAVADATSVVEGLLD